MNFKKLNPFNKSDEKREPVAPSPYLRKPVRSHAQEVFSTLRIILFLSFSRIGLYHLGLFESSGNDLRSFTYSADKTLEFSLSFLKFSIFAGFICCGLLFLLFYLIRPSGLRPKTGEKGKWLIARIILDLFGVLAFVVLDIFLDGFKVSRDVTVLLTSLCVNTYLFFIYKLYREQRTYSNLLFWEIFRFALVGLVASVFDFLTTRLLQFGAFKGNTAGYVTGLSTAGGFIIGVIINYLRSTYRVYKATKSNFSKSIVGKVYFLGLAVIGLFIGIGLQYFFYDFLNLSKGITTFSYPVCFVLRTLIVMVFNYVTRKIFIYR